MTRFMTRVQLNGYPTAEQYEKLHKEMKNRGFSRVIEGSDSKFYWLPHGEYYREVALTLNQVVNEAKAAAAAVSTDHEVLTSEAPASMWFNLKPATKADSLAA